MRWKSPCSSAIWWGKLWIPTPSRVAIKRLFFPVVRCPSHKVARGKGTPSFDPLFLLYLLEEDGRVFTRLACFECHAVPFVLSRKGGFMGKGPPGGGGKEGGGGDLQGKLHPGKTRAADDTGYTLERRRHQQKHQYQHQHASTSAGPTNRTARPGTHANRAMSQRPRSGHPKLEWRAARPFGGHKAESKECIHQKRETEAHDTRKRPPGTTQQDSVAGAHTHTRKK